MTTLIYLFRNDLRLADNPAFTLACQQARQQNLRLLPVFCHAPPELTRWGFVRVGPHRQQVLTDTLADLDAQLHSHGSALLQLHGPAAQVLPVLARLIQASGIVCEDIAAPQEQAEVAALRATGLVVQSVWQSSLLDPADLPFAVAALPGVFTQFRAAVEKNGVQPRMPLPAPSAVPPWPAGRDTTGCGSADSEFGSASGADSAWLAHPDLAIFLVPNQPLPLMQQGRAAIDFDDLDKASVPYHQSAFQGGERAGLAHLRRYLAAKLPHSYKATRNQLSGTDYSSKFSPWLASGALSPRTVIAELTAFEAEAGANDGTYWLWFELLWRDYFRFLHLQYGAALYHARGLRALDAAPPQATPPSHASASNPANADASATTGAAAHAKAAALQRWCQSQTGEPLVDAATHELRRSGYLSNRLRQVVASYLIYDLGGDWRAGAAWFESQLVDFDIYSNQSNWLYIAGLGTDPRGGRRFNVVKQTQDHDPDGRYRQLWQPTCPIHP